MRVYISGGMTGIPYKNFPAFDAAKTRLEKKGYDVVSPADLERIRHISSYFEKLRDDLKYLLTCNAIYMLDGWQKSRGAGLEYFVAKSLNFKVLYESPKSSNGRR